MSLPHFDFEDDARKRGFSAIAGVDEVGRGPLAGPVVAAAVILDPQNIPDGLNDSKQISAKARNMLTQNLRQCAQVGVGEASVEEIDSINILRASHLAMIRALQNLPTPPDYVLVDGRHVPNELQTPARPLIKGDTKSLSIAAASIVAKTWRDELMVDLAQQHPGYGWETNAGYPTKSHRLALQNLGVTPHHRRSFKPVHNILYQANFTTD